MGRLRLRSFRRDLPFYGLALFAFSMASACASPLVRAPQGSPTIPKASAPTTAAGTATSMIGAPYRYGGAAPSGFDCSGLVVYSYAEAGVPGLPHSAVGLERLTRPVSLQNLEPGDLLFFRLSGHKISHVAIYIGDRAFVHAPSDGKRVERVTFNHVYWAPRLGRAGRLVH